MKQFWKNVKAFFNAYKEVAKLQTELNDLKSKHFQLQYKYNGDMDKRDRLYKQIEELTNLHC